MPRSVGGDDFQCCLVRDYEGRFCVSTVLWIRLESDPDDFIPDDLYELFDKLDALDRHCQGLGVRTLTEFVDFSDVESNLAGEADFADDEDAAEDSAEDDAGWSEEDAKWISPAELLETLNALREDLAGDESQDGVLEELAQVIDRCEEAVHNEDRVRLIAVM